MPRPPSVLRPRILPSSWEKSVLADLEKSKQFTKKMWKKRGFLQRLGEVVFWLFSEAY